MVLYHVGKSFHMYSLGGDVTKICTVLLRMKPTTTEAQLKTFGGLIKGMVGHIPGLKSVQVGPSIQTARTQGYNWGLVAVLEKPSDLPVYAGHEKHLPVNAMRVEIADDTIAYDVDTENPFNSTPL